MKNAKSYILCVMMSILLVFAVMGEVAVRCAKDFTSDKWCINIINKQKVSGMVRESLERNFEEKENSTGIPADTYMSQLDDKWISDAVNSYITSGLDYLTGRNDEYNYSPDFTLVNKNIDKFFNDYADRNGYVKDSGFETKINSAQKNAQEIIKSNLDVVKMEKLYSEGVLKQARKYVILVNKPIVEIGSLSIIVILILLIALVNKKKISDSFYWYGCILIIPSVIMFIPMIYLKATRYFDAFIIKQEQIYVTFTSMMYKAVDTVIVTSIILFVIGIIMTALNAVASNNKKM